MMGGGAGEAKAPFPTPNISAVPEAISRLDQKKIKLSKYQGRLLLVQNWNSDMKA